MSIRVCLLAAMLALPPLAWAEDCPNIMKQVDDLLTATPTLDEETIVDEDLRMSVKDMRAKGEELHQQGKDAECVEILEKALARLKEETG